jgi:hypothetical protein
MCSFQTSNKCSTLRKSESGPASGINETRHRGSVAHHTAGATLIYVRCLALLLLCFICCCTPFATGSSTASSSSSSDAAINDDDDGGSDSGAAPGDASDNEPDAGPIGVVDPSCSRKLLVGTNAVTGSPDNISPGSIDSYGFAAGGSLSVPTAHCLWVYIAEGAGSDILVAVYDEKLGVPPIPNRQKARGTIIGVKIGWNAAVLSVDVPVSPLQTLWLATGPTKGSIKVAVNPSCASGQRPLQARNNLTAGELPDPFEPNFSQPICGAALYLSPKR